MLSDAALWAWCCDVLGAGAGRVLFRERHLSQVLGVELADGRRVVVKARPFERRIAGCTAVQAALARAGFPCPAPLAGPDRAIERMGWRNLSTYECQHNSLYLEDDSMKQGELNQDGVPRIRESDQVTLLRRGLLIARHVCDLAWNLAEPVPIRCIISGIDRKRAAVFTVAVCVPGGMHRSSMRTVADR